MSFDLRVLQINLAFSQLPKWTGGPSVRVTSLPEAEALLSLFLRASSQAFTSQWVGVWAQHQPLWALSPGCTVCKWGRRECVTGLWLPCRRWDELSAPKVARRSALMTARGQDSVYDSQREALGERVWDGLSGGRVWLWFSPGPGIGHTGAAAGILEASSARPTQEGLCFGLAACLTHCSAQH